MENFYQIFILISESNNISFNSNILETGLINIIALITILIVLGGNILEPLLNENSSNVTNNLKNAENRRSEARNKLAIAYIQLAVIQTVFNFKLFQKDKILMRKTSFQTDVFEAKKDLKNRLEQAFLTFSLKERQIFSDIKQEIIELTLKKIYDRIILLLNSNNKQEEFIDKAIIKLDTTINTLEGDSI